MGVLCLTFQVFSEHLSCRGLTKSVLNYVPYVFYVLMCLTCLHGFVLLSLTCLSFFTCFLYLHTFLSSFFTCLHFYGPLFFLRALHAFIFTCLTWLACLQFSRTLCSFFMYLQFFKVFPIVKGRALSTFSVFYKMWNNLEPTDNILCLQKIFPILFFQLKQCFLHVGDIVSSKKLTARKAHKKIGHVRQLKKKYTQGT